MNEMLQQNLFKIMDRATAGYEAAQSARNIESDKLFDLQLLATKLCEVVREQRNGTIFTFDASTMRDMANVIDAASAVEKLLGIEPTPGNKSWGDWALEHGVKK